MRTLITNGTVVTATGAHEQDVLLDGQTIAAVFTRGGADAAGVAADEVVDATGRYVLPGGIDAHTHMEMPFGGTHSADTFETGTIAAAHGGTTTIIDFAIQAAGQQVRPGLERWFEKAEGTCAIDYSFHMILGGVDDAALKEMDGLVAEGITSFKLFMAYPGVFYSDDGQILRAMQQAASNGALICMHAENGIAIDVLAEQAAARGDTDPINHGLTRPSRLEGEATHRAIQLALVAGAPLYIVHLSAQEALEHVAVARGEGHNVFAETCPQYLYLTLEDHLGKPGFEGAAYVASPPLRTRDEPHRENLWRGLRTNDLSMVATDHCPFCMKDQKELGREDFRAIPNGIGGIEHRMDLLHQGVVDGQLSLARWVETCCTTPARMFGLYPQKGVIAPGSDADVVIYDPTARHTLSVDNHHMALDHSAWEGFDITGAVESVYARGRKVIDHGSFVGRAGHGRFLKRGLSQYLQ